MLENALLDDGKLIFEIVSTDKNTEYCQRLYKVVN
jgi:hypothetical protein